MLRRTSLLALLLAGTAYAGDLDPATAAQIQLDSARATADVQKKYGNKKLSELSNDERQALAKDQAAAEQKVLDKNGVKAKDWARYEARQSRADRAATQAAKEKLLQKEAEAAEQAKKASAADEDAAEKDKDKEIPIQQGFSEDKPTILEESKDAPPIIERGTPDDAPPQNP